MTPSQDVMDKFYGQVSESIKSLFDLSSRIDERVKHLVLSDEMTKASINKLGDEIRTIMQKQAVIEAKDFSGLEQNISHGMEKMAVMDKRLSQLEKEISHLNQWKMQSRDNATVNDKRITVLESSKKAEDEAAANEKENHDYEIKDLNNRLRNMELKYEAVNIFKENTEKKHWLWMDLFFKMIWTVVAAYLLWKLGLQGPPSP